VRASGGSDPQGGSRVAHTAESSCRLFASSSRLASVDATDPLRRQFSTSSYTLNALRTGGVTDLCRFHTLRTEMALNRSGVCSRNRKTKSSGASVLTAERRKMTERIL